MNGSEMRQGRYAAQPGSQSGHCCFDATVVDTTQALPHRPDKHYAVCECFEMTDAERIAAALNAAAEEAGK